ncbi:633_t:CDS:2, partial [Racocetra fulgida]
MNSNRILSIDNSQILTSKVETRAQCCKTLDELDIILFSADKNELLHSIIDTMLLAVAEVKPEQLMTHLIKGTKLSKDKVKITDEREKLFDLYNSAVNIVDYSTNKYTKYAKILKIVQQAFGYMVCIRYFEDISKTNTNAYSTPPKPDHVNYQDLDSSISEQSDHDSSKDYELKFIKVNNSEVNTRITQITQ